MKTREQIERERLLAIQRDNDDRMMALTWALDNPKERIQAYMRDIKHVIALHSSDEPGAVEYIKAFEWVLSDDENERA